MNDRTKGRGWIVFIVALLGGSVALYAAVIVISLSDPSFAIEPDYERTAAEWDERQVAAAASDRLGWTCAVRVDPRPGGRDADLSLWLNDRWGKPVKADAVTVEAFHNARAGHVLKGEMLPADAGLFVATLPIRRPGIWQVTVRAERDEDRFRDVIRTSVGRGAPG